MGGGCQVKILTRIRPPIAGEVQDEGLNILREDGRSFITVDNIRDASQVFKYPFTSCYGPQSTQEEIFINEVEPLIDMAFNGITVTIFAYGVTSSGKTHTMQGSQVDPGIIPRAVEAVFARRTATTTLAVSYMEIYRDDVYDLLVNRENAPKLPVRENQHGQVFVANQVSLPIETEKDFDTIYSAATKRRSVASTNLNRASSRSHAVLTLNVKTVLDGKVLHGKLNLVDLAGSENNKLTGNDASRMAESAAINKSLSVLGQVVHALNQGASRIPYRNSKLTRILQDALGGSSLGLLICNIAPTAKHRQDSLNTLNFASRAKNIENKLVVNQKEAPALPKPVPRFPAGTTALNPNAGPKSAAPRPSFGGKPPSRVSRPSSAFKPPLSPDDVPEDREAVVHPINVALGLTEKDIDERIARAVEAEVERRLAERERQRAAELPIQPSEPQSSQGGTSSRRSNGQHPSAPDDDSPSRTEEELRRRLQDLEEKFDNGNAETRMVSDLSPVSRKKAGRAYVALARAQSEKGNLQLALDLYKKAESYVPDNTKLKERIMEIDCAVKNGKPFDPSPKKQRRRSNKRGRKKSRGNQSSGEMQPSHSDVVDDERKNIGVEPRPNKRRRGDEVCDPRTFTTPFKKSRREADVMDED